MEKHALNKILENHKAKGLAWEELPCIKLIGTFKDQSNLYFLTEMLKGKSEVWESCRSFGLVGD
jgi:hypothetical protein